MMNISYASVVLTNLLLKLVIPCATILSAAVLLVHVQTFDDDASLRALLLPPTDCAAPCFMGIKPGVTTADSAMQQLRTNSLVHSLSLTSFDRYDEQTINGVIDLPAEQIQLLLDAKSRTVETVTLSGISLRLGDMVVMLGQPDQVILNNKLHMGSITYTAQFPQYKMMVVADLPKCSIDMAAFWSTQRVISIEIDSAQSYTQQLDYYLTNAYENGAGGWGQQITAIEHENCM